MSHGKKAPIDQNLPREKEYEGKSTKTKKPKNGKILKCKEIIKKYKRKKTVIKIKKNTPIRKKECKKHREKSTKGRGNKIVIQKINLNQTKRQSKNPNSVRKTSNRQAAMVNKNKRRLIMAGKISRDNHFRRGNRPADVTTSLSNKTTNQRQSIDKLDVTETNYRGGRIPMWYKSTNTRRIVSSIKTFMRTTSLSINLLMRNTKSLNRKYSEKIKIIKLYKVYKYFFNDSKESKIKINKEKEPKPENTAKGDGKESDSNNNITPEEKNTQSEENEENIFSTPSSSSHIPENGKNAEQTLQINEQSIAQNTRNENKQTTNWWNCYENKQTTKWWNCHENKQTTNRWNCPDNKMINAQKTHTDQNKDQHNTYNIWSHKTPAIWTQDKKEKENNTINQLLIKENKSQNNNNINNNLQTEGKRKETTCGKCGITINYGTNTPKFNITTGKNNIKIYTYFCSMCTKYDPTQYIKKQFEKRDHKEEHKPQQIKKTKPNTKRPISTNPIGEKDIKAINANRSPRQSIEYIMKHNKSFIKRFLINKNRANMAKRRGKNKNNKDRCMNEVDILEWNEWREKNMNESKPGIIAIDEVIKNLRHLEQDETCENISISIITLKEIVENNIHNNQNAKKEIKTIQDTWLNWLSKKKDNTKNTIILKLEVTRNQRNRWKILDILKTIRKEDKTIQDNTHQTVEKKPQQRTPHNSPRHHRKE